MRRLCVPGPVEMVTMIATLATRTPQSHLTTMEIDPKDVIESAQKASDNATAEQKTRRLNAAVAITVALLATFMAICKVKDDNIVQAMQQAQADKIDHWAFYQARNLRQELAQATLIQLQLSQRQATGNKHDFDEAIAKYQALMEDQGKKKEELRLQALQDQTTYDTLNVRDDQFDLADAALAIAVALLAVTALTSMWPLYWGALIPTAFGVVMGLAGLIGWDIHPDFLVKLLT